MRRSVILFLSGRFPNTIKQAQICLYNRMLCVLCMEVSHVRGSETQEIKLPQLLQVHPALPGQIHPVFSRTGAYHWG